MQRVVRSSLIGLLAMAGLTACGDKVELTQTSPVVVTPVVRSVTVSPSSANLNVGDKVTLAASVNADAGITDRTVTWSSSDATIASVDATTGVVTGVKAGTATITAASKADASVKGAALITVAGGQPGGVATISISTINQTTAAGSVPANLGNVVGQIDVTFNVDPSNQRLLGVDLVMNCTGNGNSGQDTVVATQTLATTNVVDAAAASAPVTLSFNTASFNSSTGAVAIRNGQCTIKGRARTNAVAGGAVTTVTSTSSTLTINNTDVVIGTITPALTKINPVTNAAWVGGAKVDVAIVPVMYSGRVPATANVTFAGVTSTTPSTATGPSTFTFNNPFNATSGVTNSLGSQTTVGATATFSLIDTNGNAFASPCGAGNLCTSASVLAGAPAAIAAVNLDTQKPNAGTFSTTSNPDQGINGTGYVGGSFRFVADSAAGFRGPNAVAGNQTQNLDNAGGTAGVDNVTVVFQSAPSGTSRTSSTWANITSTAGLSETVAANTLIYRMITADALGNTDTTLNTSSNTLPAFGVDKTAPTNTQTGTANQTTTQAPGTAGNIVATITDALSGPSTTQLVAQVLLNNAITSTSQPTNNTVYSNVPGANAPGSAPTFGCLIGRFNRTSGAANADTLALPIFNAAGTQIGTCSPTPYSLTGGTTVASNTGPQAGYVTTRIVAVDQAGNRAAATTVAIAEDATAPTVGALDLPTSATGGAAFTIPAQVFDANDVIGSAIQLVYNGSANVFQYPTTAGPGTAFDNSLQPGSATTAATASPTISFFARNLKVGAAGTISNPTQAANGVATVAVGAIDQSSWTGKSGLVNLTATTTVQQPSASSTVWAADFTGGVVTTVNNASVSNCPTAGCTGGAAAANPLTTTVTVTAQGATGTFANPFSRVEVWYQVNNSGSWFFAGVAGAGSSRDTGVGGSRFWDYTFTFTPPKTAQRDVSVAAGTAADLTVNGTTLNLMGIGLNANGDGLMAATVATITLTNP